MIIEKEGYEYRGFYLGATVTYKETGEMFKIIGFSRDEESDMFIAINRDYFFSHLNDDGCYGNIVILEDEGKTSYEWVAPYEIEIQDYENIIKNSEKIFIKSETKIIKLLGYDVDINSTTLGSDILSIFIKRNFNQEKIMQMVDFWTDKEKNLLQVVSKEELEKVALAIIKTGVLNK